MRLLDYNLLYLPLKSSLQSTLPTVGFGCVMMVGSGGGIKSSICWSKEIVQKLIYSYFYINRTLPKIRNLSQIYHYFKINIHCLPPSREAMNVSDDKHSFSNYFFES